MKQRDDSDHDRAYLPTAPFRKSHANHHTATVPLQQRYSFHFSKKKNHEWALSRSGTPRLGIEYQ